MAENGNGANPFKITQQIPVWTLVVGMLAAGAAWGNLSSQNSALQTAVQDMRVDVKEIRGELRTALEKYNVNRADLQGVKLRLSNIERRLDALER